MELELKHLAPYLPYDLLAVDFKDGLQLNKRVVASNIMIFLDGSTNSKIVLRPLSDLLSQEWRSKIYALNLSSTDWTTKEHPTWIKIHGHYGWLNRVPYGVITFLLENHFDIYNLIEKNLAISINTLKK